MSFSATLLAVGAAAALAAAPRAPATPAAAAASKTQKKDNDAQAAALNAVRLPRDEEYFAANEERVEALQTHLAQVLDAATTTSAGSEPTALPPVLAIGAPRTIPLDRRNELPLLVARRTTGLRAWQVGEGRNLRLVSTDLRTGQVRTARLTTTRKRQELDPPSGSGNAPDAVNAATVNVVLKRQPDVRRLLGLGWRPGRLALTAIAFDWVSNTVVVDLRGKGETDRAAAAPDRAPTSPTAKVEGRAISSPAPQGGLSLEFPPRIAEGSRLQVLGSLRLPVSEVVLKPEPGAKGGDSVLAASLLLVRLDAEDPIQVDVALPSRLRGRAGPPALVEAGFSIDLPLTQALAPPGAYQIYLVTGPHVAGPYPLTIAAP